MPPSWFVWPLKGAKMIHTRLMPGRTKPVMSVPQLDVVPKHRSRWGIALGVLVPLLMLSGPNGAAIATAEVAVGIFAGHAAQDKIRPIQICQPVGTDGTRRLNLPCEQPR
jgi:hypothetical protein